jgi:hypothetical protein
MAIMRPVDKTEQQTKTYRLMDENDNVVWSYNTQATKTHKVAEVTNGQFNYAEAIGVLASVLTQVNEYYKNDETTAFNYDDAPYDFHFGYAINHVQFEGMSNTRILRDVTRAFLLFGNGFVVSYPSKMETHLEAVSKTEGLIKSNGRFVKSNYCLDIDAKEDGTFLFNVRIPFNRNGEYKKSVWSTLLTFTLDDDAVEDFDLLRYEGTDEEWDEVDA